MTFRDFLAEKLFEKELDDAYALGTREGYRIGSNEARRHWFDFLSVQLTSLHDAADAKHKHGLGLALSYLSSVEVKEKANDES